jgi:hypothetical protein
MISTRTRIIYGFTKRKLAGYFKNDCYKDQRREGNYQQCGRDDQNQKLTMLSLKNK